MGSIMYAPIAKYAHSAKNARSIPTSNNGIATTIRGINIAIVSILFSS